MQTQLNLASRIQIVTLETGAWRAQKLNRAESHEVNKKHGTGDAAKVIVQLTDHPALLALYKLHAEAYGEHRRITLPSIQDGMRIVPTGKQIDHAKIISEFRAKHDSLVGQFMPDYPTLRADAPIKLNGLHDASKWPEPSVVAGKFLFSVRYLPCPSDGAWGDWLNETAEAGQAELRERLVTAARHLADTLKGDGKLFQSALDNLKDICDLSGEGFNLLDDPIIARAARELRPLSIHTADALRDAKAVRKSTGEQISNILGVLKLA